MSPGFRPLTAGEVISQAIKAFGQLFWKLFGLAAVVLIPLYLVLGVGAVLFGVVIPIAVDNGDGAAELVGALAVGAVVAIAAQTLLASSVSAMVAQGYLAAPPDWSRAMQAAAAKFGSLLWAALEVTAAVVGVTLVPAVLTGVIASAVPSGAASATVVVVGLLAVAALGVYVAISLVAVLPVVLFEDQRGLAALRRARSLARGRWWATLGTLLTVGLIGAGITIVAQTAAGVVAQVSPSVGGLVAIVLSVTAALALAPLAQVAVTLVYFDLRNREGTFDPSRVGAEIGVVVPAATPRVWAPLGPARWMPPPTGGVPPAEGPPPAGGPPGWNTPPGPHGAPGWGGTMPPPVAPPAQSPPPPPPFAPPPPPVTAPLYPPPAPVGFPDPPPPGWGPPVVEPADRAGGGGGPPAAARRAAGTGASAAARRSRPSGTVACGLAEAAAASASGRAGHRAGRSNRTRRRWRICRRGTAG